VSSSVAGVDVVGPHHHPRELLRCIVHLVGGLGTAEHAKAVHAARALLSCGREPLGDAIECFVPGCGHELAFDPHQWSSQPLLGKVLLGLVLLHGCVPLLEALTVHARFVVVGHGTSDFVEASLGI